LSPALSGAGATTVTNALLALDPSIPSVGGSTCDGVWSGAGKVYVRRATETVLSTSGARALWGNVSGLPVTCSKLILQDGARPTQFDPYTRVMGGDVWYSLAASTALEFIVADANTFPSPDPASGAVGRLNPMAAGTTITATTPTTGLTVQVNGGAAVPSSTEATRASVGVNFVTTNAGKVFVTFTSPSGVGTTYGIDVRNQAPPSSCSP